MKVEDVVRRVQEALGHDPNPPSIISMVTLTIAALGMGVDTKGEVYNPAPRETVFQVHPQQNVRWRGGGRRR